MKLLQASSLFFATLPIHAYYRHLPILHHAWVGLTVSSLVYHSKLEAITRQIWYVIDQLMIYTVVLAGAVLVPSLPSGHIWACVATFGTCGFLWVVGSARKIMTHDPDHHVAAFWHGLMHVIAAIGHHALMDGTRYATDTPDGIFRR